MGEDILLLAGSAEAREIARAVLAGGLLAQGEAVRAVMSEHPKGPNPMPVPYTVIGTPDAETLGQEMRGARAVVDASHGFDGAMTRAGAQAAQVAGLPFVTLSRPMWDLGPDPDWHRSPDVATAMPLVLPGARVFSATGWQSLEACAAFPGAVFMLRQTSAHNRAPPFDFVKLVFGTPPFDRASEAALFSDLGVDTLIARNLGGGPSRPKVDAACDLGLRIILIDRPALPEGIEVLGSVDAVLAWIAAR